MPEPALSGGTLLLSLVAGSVHFANAAFANRCDDLVGSDGRWLAYMTISNGGRNPGVQRFTVSIEEQDGQWQAGTPEPFVESQFLVANPVFSPDGRWVAYQTNESGRDEVDVRPFPLSASGQDGKWQISNNGGTQPRWSQNANELLYQEGNRIMAVRYSVGGDAFVAERPRVYLEDLGGTDWALAPDGRIAVVTSAQSENPEAAPAADQTVVFLENFFDELRRRVPVE